MVQIMIGDFASGIVAGLAVAMPIGAIGSYLVGLGARERASVAAAAALGVASVDGGYAIIAGLGGAGLQALLVAATEYLTWAAALILAAVAARTMQLAISRFRGNDGAVAGLRKLTPARAYLNLAALTALNPATVITFAAVVIGRPAGGAHSSWPALALFAIGAFVASACWQLLLTGGGSLLGQLLRGRRGQLAISVCSALLMLGLATGLLLG